MGRTAKIRIRAGCKTNVGGSLRVVQAVSGNIVGVAQLNVDDKLLTVSARRFQSYRI